jgi:hypothetical protein
VSTIPVHRSSAHPGEAPATASKPSWRRRLGFWLVSEEQVAADALRDEAARVGATTACDCQDRQVVSVHGLLRSVTLQPHDGSPALEAEVYDGTGVVTLVWLGRRRIPAVECGRSVTATGRVLVHDGRRVIYNPTYELDPLPAA